MKTIGTNKLKNCLERHYFQSLNDYVDYCDAAPSNFKNGKQSSITGGYDFTGTESYEQASEYVRKGWDEGAQKVVQRVADAASEGKNSYSAPVPHLDVAGACPVVSEWLGGNPECMLNAADPLDFPVVTVCIHIGALYDVSTEKMMNRGIGVLLACHAIEMAGSTVQILAYSGQIENSSKKNRKWADAMIQIKRPDEGFDVHVLAYALAHPSMFRYDRGRRHGSAC